MMEQFAQSSSRSEIVFCIMTLHSLVIIIDFSTLISSYENEVKSLAIAWLRSALCEMACNKNKTDF